MYFVLAKGICQTTFGGKNGFVQIGRAKEGFLQNNLVIGWVKVTIGVVVLFIWRERYRGSWQLRVILLENKIANS